VVVQTNRGEGQRRKTGRRRTKAQNLSFEGSLHITTTPPKSQMARALAKEQAGEQSSNGTFSAICVPCFGNEKFLALPREHVLKKEKIKKSCLV
jgi:hypothetical protein